MPTIRPYRARDLGAIYDVCVRTADAGDDARGHYLDDRLVGDVYAAPYAVLEPDHAFVVDDDGVVVGYVLGTADTSRFIEAFRDRWLPHIRDRYPQPVGDQTTPDGSLLALLHHPDRLVAPAVVVADAPAHLHVDLLPSHQGQGLGSWLLATFFASVHEAGARAVHLGVSTRNQAALRFYERLGFRRREVSGPDDVVYLVRSTADPLPTDAGRRPRIVTAGPEPSRTNGDA